MAPPRVLVVFALVAALGVAGRVSAQQLDVGRVLGIVGKVAQASTDMPFDQERRIGAGMAAQLLGMSPLLRDPVVERYVNSLGLWLALHTEEPNWPWRFGVLDSDTVNAFAAPGGYVFVTKGLLRVAGSEAEVAGVLAHEIAHVLKRHYVVALRKQATAGIATDILGLLANRKGVNLDGIISAGMQIYSKGLDRDDELQADRMGVVIAARSGYSPYGLPRMLLALGALDHQQLATSIWLAAHPPVRDRLAALEREMPAVLDRYATQPRDVARYAAIRARLGLPGRS
jgi:predicted Zn-dependent protease